MKKLLRFVIISFLISIIQVSAGTTGKISGTIRDAMTGEPLPFVNVVIVGTNLGAAADIDGFYNILNIQPGTYSVKASAIGYNAVTVENVRVNIDLTTTVDFELSETSIQLSEDIVVTATKPLIRKDQTASTAIVGDDLIRELPVTEVSDVLQLQSGIVVSAGGDIHVRGGRSGQVSYQIDGVPITDSYDGSTVVEVNSSAVKELQVVSGAFNAEYGQALSGVVNLVTKDGSNDFSGSITAYSGDYISSRDNVFWNMDDIDPIAVRNTEFSLSGPFIKDMIYFFVNARYYHNAGYLYGRRDFLVTDRASEVAGSGGSEYEFTQNGNGEYVSMNPNTRYFGQGKLTYQVASGLRLSYNYLIERQEYQHYNHGRKLTPDNNLQRFEKSYSNIFSLNHAISNSSFYTLNLSYYFRDYRHYLYEDIYTGDASRPTEYIDNSLLQTPAYVFEVGGTDYNRFHRNSGTYSAKLDWTTQFTNEVNVQFGGEFKRHQLYYQNINLAPMLDENGQKVTPFNVRIPEVTTQDYDQYTRNPIEGSAYVQAKFEAFNLIFNAGVRFDIFEPDGVVLSDPTDPNIVDPLRPENQARTLEERRTYWYKEASVKTQLSPRLGLAFPITDKGVIHFSYGHFFQLPRYEYLYTNPDFEIGVGSGNQGLFGNADLRPQKTVKGEIGLQQQIGSDMAVDVTVFFEDFRDLTGTQTEEILVFGRDRSYSQYANSDFGSSKGIILKFTKRFADGLATNIDYTYSVTKGNASNPADARNAVLGGALPETFIAPLDWDQSHTLNISVAYSVPKDWGFSIIGNFYSGQPYTPAVNKNTRVTQNAFPRNSADKPNIFNIDMRVYKDFEIGGTTISVFMKVFNLLDLENPRNVYSDSGDPYFTFGKYEAELINPPLYGINTLDELYTDPTRFSEPRRIELGVSYFF
ncbi:MAG: TonB-dependent receptor [Melioribacteraceae bacterium]|nr:TonB-dependent receptor [Melioribacteraceae bacterium]